MTSAKRVWLAAACYVILAAGLHAAEKPSAPCAPWGRDRPGERGLPLRNRHGRQEPGPGRLSPTTRTTPSRASRSCSPAAGEVLGLVEGRAGRRRARPSRSPAATSRSKARVEIRPRYFTLTVDEVSGAELDWLQFCNLRVKMTRTSARWSMPPGTTGSQPACWPATTAPTAARTACRRPGRIASSASRGPRWPSSACPPAGPIRRASCSTRSRSSSWSRGCRTRRSTACGSSGPRERFASYLMVGGVNQKNIDQVIEFARGGFGCVELFWWRSTPTYEPNPSSSPTAWPGSKRWPTRSTPPDCSSGCT